MTIDHPVILETRSAHWRNEADCEQLAIKLASRPGIRCAFIALHGHLGAGKTSFVRYLLRAMGVTGRIKSPTFAVLETYEVAGLSMAHFDFYRFSQSDEWLDAGFRDVFAQPGLKLVEWPEKAGPGLPVPDLRMTIDISEKDETRHVLLDALTPLGKGLLP